MEKNPEEKSSEDNEVKDVVYKKVQFLPVHIGPVSTSEELSIKVLSFRNKKLAQRIEERKKIEGDLKQRIEQLEKRQTQDDAVLNVVNRYWNQLNEDIRILLQRFNAETTDESETLNECQATTSFLMQLSFWDKEELDEKLANRVQVSKRAVAKVIQAFDRMLQRHDKVAQALKELSEHDKSENLEPALKDNYIIMQAENKNLHELNTKLHEEHHLMSLKMRDLEDKLNARDTETAELKNRLDNAEYEGEQLRSKVNKVEHYLAEAAERLKQYDQIYKTNDGSAKPSSAVADSPAATGTVVIAAAAATGNSASINYKKIEDLQEELEEQRELANNRLQELEATNLKLRETLKECEGLKTEIRQLPESVIVETTEYKCLQSQYSVLYHECMRIRKQLEECLLQLQTVRHNHIHEVEAMEGEEFITQRKLRTDILQLEDRNAVLRREQDVLRMELEKTALVNEQSGPIVIELKQLLKSLQTHNTHLKAESQRFRRKYKDCSKELSLLKKENHELKERLRNHHSDSKEPVSVDLESEEIVVDDIKEECKTIATTPHCDTIKIETVDLTKPSKRCERNSHKTPISGSNTASRHSTPSSSKKGDTPNKGAPSKEVKIIETDSLDLKAQLKKALNVQKDLRLLLDMYKQLNKEQRDKPALMASEKKLKAEIEELKQQLRVRKEVKKEDHKCEHKDLINSNQMLLFRLRHLEEECETLKRERQKFQTEEAASLNELEVTGQAFDELEEQNIRLVQAMAEKDDANFKLMTERIKCNQYCKTIKEGKESMQEMVTQLTTQLEAANIVIKKLEEKERILLNNLTSMEKEITLSRQILEVYKRKAIESAQSAADLKMHLEKYHSQMKEAQQVVAEKTSSLEAEAYKTNRLQEELSQLRRKVERLKKIEAAETWDAVLMEEIKEYKETLTCPSCKVKRKDAVLTKCFHVFCFDCLRTRYETRQRKCPKCNAAFGANDYHRLYLGN